MTLRQRTTKLKLKKFSSFQSRASESIFCPQLSTFLGHVRASRFPKMGICHELMHDGTYLVIFNKSIGATWPGRGYYGYFHVRRRDVSQKLNHNSTFAMSTCAGLRGRATARKRGFPQRFAQCANLHNHKLIRGLRSVQTYTIIR